MRDGDEHVYHTITVWHRRVAQASGTLRDGGFRHHADTVKNRYVLVERLR